MGVVDASPSFSLGQDGAATTKKNDGLMMRAVITMCFLLGTLAVLFSVGSRGRKSRTARSTGGLSAALLRGHNPAASVYDPWQDWCHLHYTDAECNIHEANN